VKGQLSLYCAVLVEDDTHLYTNIFIDCLSCACVKIDWLIDWLLMEGWMDGWMVVWTNDELSVIYVVVECNPTFHYTKCMVGIQFIFSHKLHKHKSSSSRPWQIRFSCNLWIVPQKKKQWARKNASSVPVQITFF
jgi:hypothetical protein